MIGESLGQARPDANPKAESFSGWKLVFAFWLILVANVGFPIFSAGVINAYMAKDLNIDRGALGSAFGLLRWTMALGAPITAYIVHRRGIRFTIALGSLLLLASSISMAFLVRSGLQFVIVFGIVIGLGIAMGGPLAAQVGASRWFTQRKALAISLVLTGPTVGGAVAPVIVDRLIAASHGQWRSGWLLIAALNLLAFGMASIFVKESPSHLGQTVDGIVPPHLVKERANKGGVQNPVQQDAVWSIREAMKMPVLWLLIAVSLGLYAGNTLILAHGILHLEDLGYPPEQAAVSFSVILVGTLVGNMLFAWLGDRIQQRLLLAFASALYGVGMLVALHASGTFSLYFQAVLLGLGFGIAFMVFQTLPSSYFGDGPYAALVSILLIAETGIGAAAALGAGFMFDKTGSYSAAFYLVSGMCFFGALLALFLKPPVKRIATDFPHAGTT